MPSDTPTLTPERIAERLRARKAFGRFPNDSHWHMFDQPDADCVAAADAIERLTAERDEQAAIVARIWKQFGSPAYEQLAGRSIYDLIDAALSEAKALREAAASIIAAVADIDDGTPEELRCDGDMAIGEASYEVVTVGHCRALRAILSPASDDKGGEV